MTTKRCDGRSLLLRLRSVVPTGIDSPGACTTLIHELRDGGPDRVARLDNAMTPGFGVQEVGDQACTEEVAVEEVAVTDVNTPWRPLTIRVESARRRCTRPGLRRGPPGSSTRWPRPRGPWGGERSRYWFPATQTHPGSRWCLGQRVVRPPLEQNSSPPGPSVSTSVSNRVSPGDSGRWPGARSPPWAVPSTRARRRHGRRRHGRDLRRWLGPCK